MAIKHPGTDLLGATLAQPDYLPRLPQQRRLYEAAKAAILNQQLVAGSKLPSTRRLAQELGIARNTVIAAFEQLAAEGFITTAMGSGTYVSASLPAMPFPKGSASDSQNPETVRQTIPADALLSRRGQQLTHFAAGLRYEIQPFAPGDDDFSNFPYKIWQRLQNRVWRESWSELLDYGNAGGYLPLRRAITEYLRVSRSVNVSVDQVLITAGTHQSLALCAELLADSGDTAWVENPCYWGASRVFESCNLRLHPIAIDADGMAPATDDLASKPRLIYMTPSHQYPLGTVMSLSRRRLLLALAERENTWILEDDYDSEFRYSGHPLAALKGLDTQGRVIYMGTFSKVLYPGIKVGYMVVPAALAEPFKSALYDLHRPGQLMVQATLADFIEHGHFATHIRKIRHAYGEKRELLRKALAAHSNNAIRISEEESGLHLVIELPDTTDDVALAALAAESQLAVKPLSSYYLQGPARRGLLVGYAYVNTDKIAYYGKLLAHVIQAGLHK